MTNTKQPQAPAAYHFSYTNWRGETAVRQAFPIRVFFGKTEWHPDPQWLMEALDVEKGEPRVFAMCDMAAPGKRIVAGQVATVIPYTDEDGRADHEMDNWRMLAIGRPGDIPEHVLDRIPADAAEIIRQHSEAQATEIVRLKDALEADYDLVTRELAARTAEFVAMKDRATKAEAALADHIKEDEAWSGDVVQAVLDLVGIDDPDPDGYYAQDLKSMLDDYDAEFTDVTALAEELASEMTRARDVMSIFIDEHSDPGTDAMASHHCMSALIRKARSAGLLARTPATLIDRIATAHTPGGWNRNIPPARKYSVIFAGRNTHVCSLSIKGLSDEEIEANANLIAAAPDLLEALQVAARLLRAAGAVMDVADTQAINRAILRACGGVR